jgi:hypothetical protein
MLISHKNQFIYTKTSRTAGTSVESYFEKFCMPEDKWEFSHAREEYVSKEGIIGYRGYDARGKKWFNHMSALEIRNNIGNSIWNNYFKFCVIRNPFDKLISAFFFVEEQKRNRSVVENLKSRLAKVMGKSQPIDCIKGENSIERFRSWIRRGGSMIDRDKYLITGEICVDYFIRYEDLENGIKHVCNLLNIPFEPERIPRLKSALRDRKIPLSDFYDEEIIQIVSRIYEFEIDEFGYSMPE